MGISPYDFQQLFRASQAYLRSSWTQYGQLRGTLRSAAACTALLRKRMVTGPWQMLQACRKNSTSSNGRIEGKHKHPNLA